MTEHWIGTPEVDLDKDSLEISQDVEVSNIRARDAVRIARYSDGSVLLTNRSSDSISMPAHWLPIIAEFFAKTEVSA